MSGCGEVNGCSTRSKSRGGLRISQRPRLCYERYIQRKKQESLPALISYDLTGNRTRVYAVRGRRLSRLTIRPYAIGFQFTTIW